MSKYFSSFKVCLLTAHLVLFINSVIAQNYVSYIKSGYDRKNQTMSESWGRLTLSGDGKLLTVFAYNDAFAEVFDLEQKKSSLIYYPKATPITGDGKVFVNYYSNIIEGYNHTAYFPFKVKIIGVTSDRTRIVTLLDQPSYEVKNFPEPSSIQVWNLEEITKDLAQLTNSSFKLEEKHLVKNLVGSKYGINFNPDNGLFSSESFSGLVFHNVLKNTETTNISFDEAGVSSGTFRYLFSQSANYVVAQRTGNTLNSENNLVLINRTTGEAITGIDANVDPKAIIEVCISPTDNYLAYKFKDKKGVYVFNIKTLKLETILPLDGYDMQFSNTGKYFSIIDKEGVNLISTSDWKLMASLDIPKLMIFSKDDSKIYSYRTYYPCSSYGNCYLDPVYRVSYVQIFDLDKFFDGKQLAGLVHAGENRFAYAVSDNLMLNSAHYEENFGTSILDNPYPMVYINMDDAGKYILTSLESNTKLWNANTGQLIEIFANATGGVFSKDGKYLQLWNDKNEIVDLVTGLKTTSDNAREFEKVNLITWKYSHANIKALPNGKSSEINYELKKNNRLDYVDCSEKGQKLFLLEYENLSKLEMSKKALVEFDFNSNKSNKVFNGKFKGVPLINKGFDKIITPEPFQIFDLSTQKNLIKTEQTFDGYINQTSKKIVKEGCKFFMNENKGFVLFHEDTLIVLDENTGAIKYSYVFNDPRLLSYAPQNIFVKGKFLIYTTGNRAIGISVFDLETGEHKFKLVDSKADEDLNHYVKVDYDIRYKNLCNFINNQNEEKLKAPQLTSKQLKKMVSEKQKAINKQIMAQVNEQVAKKPVYETCPYCFGRGYITNYSTTYSREVSGAWGYSSNYSNVTTYSKTTTKCSCNNGKVVCYRPECYTIDYSRIKHE